MVCEQSEEPSDWGLVADDGARRTRVDGGTNRKPAVDNSFPGPMMSVLWRQPCRKTRHYSASSLRNWLLLYIVTFFLVLPFFFGLCSQSAYFAIRRHLLDPGTYLHHVENNDRVRMKRAEDYFRSADPENVKLTLDRIAKKKPHLDIAIVVVTAAREPGKTQSKAPEYVTETISQLLSQMTDADIMSDFPYSVKMIVCNGGTNPALNTPAIRLKQYLRVINLPGKSPPKTTQGKLENESMDYMLCLRESLQYSPRYILALEDDAYAREDVWNVLKYVISQKLDRRITRERTVTDNSHVAYVKLMRPEYQLCYFKRGLDDKLELLGASLLLGTIATLVHRLVRKVFYPESYRRREYWTWLAWCVYVFLVIITIGRPCLLELRRFFAPHLYMYVPAQNCCIPAVLFPRHGARALVDYLNSTSTKHLDGKDILMDYMLVEKEMKAYQVFPSAFTHIGHISTKLNRDAFHVY